MDFCTTTTTTPTSLSLQDLITAPAKAESLLELLTPDQILAIEQTLVKVKRRRLDNKEEMANDTNPTTTSASTVATVASNLPSVSSSASATAAAAATAATSIINTSNTSTAKNVATTASAAVTPLSSSNQNVKPTTSTSTTTTTTPNEPVTEVRDGIEWVSFVYSHNRALKRYSIRTDLAQVDTSLIDDKFKNENCVSSNASSSSS